MTGLAHLVRIYDRHETIADAIVHAVGLVLALIGVGALVAATALSAPAGSTVARASTASV